MTTESKTPLGVGLRLVQAYFALVMLQWFVTGVFHAGEHFAYDLSLVDVFVTLPTCAMGIWLIQRRHVLARTVVPGLLAFSGAVTLIDNLLFGGPVANSSAFDPSVVLGLASTVAGVAIRWGTVAYLALSPHVREVLDQGEGGERLSYRQQAEVEHRRLADANDFWPRPMTWAWWRQLGFYYMGFSLVGHWAEIGFCLLIVAGVVMGDYDFSNRMLWEWVLYPYPAEAVAGVLVIVLLDPLKRWLLRRFDGRVLPALVVSFLVTGIVCTAIDFGAGMLWNANYELWDYRLLPFNFMGQICLQNSIVYTVAATLILWLVHPALTRSMRSVSSSALDAVFIGMASVYVFLSLLYLVTPPI